MLMDRRSVSRCADVRAQCNLGRWYQRHGDLLSARRCFRLSAAQGHVSSVGLMAAVRAALVPAGRTQSLRTEGRAWHSRVVPLLSPASF
jgi:hypothetical protein